MAKKQEPEEISESEALEEAVSRIAELEAELETVKAERDDLFEIHGKLVAALRSQLQEEDDEDLRPFVEGVLAVL